MKQFTIALFVLMVLTLVGCGSSNTNASNVNGTWNATLTSATSGSPVFTFGTSLQLNSDGSLNITNFSFNTSSPCFVSGDTESGSFTLAGNFNGQTTGTFGFTIKSGTPSGNTLTLSGAVTGNTISGTWTLTGGTGCSGNGTFTMTRM